MPGGHETLKFISSRAPIRGGIVREKALYL